MADNSAQLVAVTNIEWIWLSAAVGAVAADLRGTSRARIASTPGSGQPRSGGVDGVDRIRLALPPAHAALGSDHFMDLKPSAAGFGGNPGAQAQELVPPCRCTPGHRNRSGTSRPAGYPRGPPDLRAVPNPGQIR